MKIAKSEADIRDFLAKNLDMIEPGLMLQKKEQYLKNDNGASGFVDIFARDQKGRIVIIEIKIGCCCTSRPTRTSQVCSIGSRKISD